MTDRGQFLSEPVSLAWEAFDRAANLPCRVTPAMPILFFGDLEAYRASQLRVLTVGLNPSLHEFPTDEPFRRFPLAEGNREPRRYLDALSGYFGARPYRSWFDALLPLLKGLGASYYKGAASTALHTDICSPVATCPKWSKLSEGTRAALEATGIPLWHKLLEELRPQVVAISVAKAHLDRIQFVPLEHWKVVHVFECKKNGERRSRPYKIRARWHNVGGEHSLFVFGEAAQTPFGLLGDGQKREAGERLRKEYLKSR
ncbi:MAG: hypothetical protein OXE48_03320 [Gammaproteobacteria bacterium]|nr:hypothetical protein [Gammaproteobacteria bacterium]